MPYTDVHCTYNATAPGVRPGRLVPACPIEKFTMNYAVVQCMYTVRLLL